MKRLFPLILFLLSAPLLLSQNAGRDNLFFDALSFAAPTPDSAQIDLYLSVPYVAVTFARVEGNYTAVYHAHVSLRRDKDLLFDSTFVRTVSTSSYDVSAGRIPSFDFFQQRLTVAPGSYQASVELLDTKSNLVSNADRTFTVPNYSVGPFALSSPMLVGKIREESTGYVIVPMLTDNISVQPDGYFLFFETYNRTDGTDFNITARYNLSTGDSVSALTFAKTIPTGRSQQWVHLPSTGLARGKYTVTLSVAAHDAPSTVIASTQRAVRFSEALDGMPISDGELDERITQLRYVATQNDIDDIRDAGDYSARRKKYAEFWERLDPTPGTPANEAMTEYYRRIDFANQNFRSYAAGWLTDKGRVYVIFGPADNVSTDNFRTDGRNVEVWQYYSRNLRLTFVDDSGFGDYRLVTPLPLGEKYHYPG
jgi:GWxTD domain-containing protein